VLVPDSLHKDAAILVLSPHLDDAVLSCGSFLAAASVGRPVTVITLFTACSTGRVTLSARSYLRQCNARRAGDLYEQRRVEDRIALRGIGVTAVHYDLPDALFRRHRRSRVPARVAALLPELDCVYPTFRFHVARGRIASADLPLLDELQRRVLLMSSPQDLVLAPLGLGSHVDHVLTHELGRRLVPGRRVGWYADQPYLLRGAGPARAPVGHSRINCPGEASVKAELVAGYRTQVAALFDGGPVPELEEHIYLPDRSVPQPHPSGPTVRTCGP